MAYGEVTEDNVYLCCGHPLRKDIENIVRWLLNVGFDTAYNSILVLRLIVELYSGHSGQCTCTCVMSLYNVYNVDGAADEVEISIF